MDFESFPVVEGTGARVVGVSACTLGAATASDDAARVLVTYADNGVEAHDVRERACVRSWPQVPGGKFTRAAVLHAPTQTLWSSRGDSLLSWEVAAPSLKSLRSVNVGDEVFAVVPAGDRFVAAVSVYGGVTVCGPDMATAGASSTAAPAPGARAFWAEAAAPSGGCHRVLVATQTQTAAWLRVTVVTDASGAPSDLPSTPLPVPAPVVSVAFDPSTRTLSTLSADGTWSLVELTEQYGVQRVKRTWPLRCLDIPAGVASAWAGEDLVLFVGTLSASWRPRGAGALPQPGTRVAVAVESLYGTAQAVRALSADADGALRATPVSAGLVAVAAGSSVFACRARARGPVTLKAAIGRGALSVAGAAAEPPLSALRPLLASVSEALAEAEQREGGPVAQLRSSALAGLGGYWAGTLRSENRVEEEFLRKLSDPELTPSPAEFEAVFTEFLELLAPQSLEESADVSPVSPAAVLPVNLTAPTPEPELRVEAEPGIDSDDEEDFEDEFQTTSGSESKEGEKRAVLPFRFVQCVAQRVCCAEESVTTLWPAMRTLLRLGCVTHSEAPGALSACVAQGHLAGLEDCLRHLQDIPDAEIAMVLKYLISRVTDEELDAYRVNGAESVRACRTADDVRRVLLNHVIALPRNEVFAHRYLQSLSAGEVSRLLLHLRAWLWEYHAHAEVAPSAHGGVVPALRQVVRWVESVIDAHVSQLVLVPECREAVRDIGRYLAEALELCESARAVKPYLSQIVRRRELPQACLPDYQIEVLQIARQ